MGKEYTVRILNWKKYQGREVKTRSSWLRFENDFFDNPNFSTFSSEERNVWIYAMCCASKLNSDTLHVPLQCSHQRLHQCMRIDENTFYRTFEKLKKLRIVEIRTTRGRYAHDTFANADDTQTTHYEDETRRYVDETRRDETKDSCSFAGANARVVADALEVLYQRYPRKIGKTPGLKRLASQIKTKEDFDAVARALDRFKAQMLQEQREATKIPYFSTWVSSWRDWLDPETGTSEVAPAEDPFAFLKEGNS